MKYYIFSYNWEYVASYDSLEQAEKNRKGREHIVYKKEDIKKLIWG